MDTHVHSQTLVTKNVSQIIDNNNNNDEDNNQAIGKTPQMESSSNEFLLSHQEYSEKFMRANKNHPEVFTNGTKKP